MIYYSRILFFFFAQVFLLSCGVDSSSGVMDAGCRFHRVQVRDYINLDDRNIDDYDVIVDLLDINSQYPYRYLSGYRDLIPLEGSYYFYNNDELCKVYGVAILKLIENGINPNSVFDLQLLRGALFDYFDNNEADVGVWQFFIACVLNLESHADVFTGLEEYFRNLDYEDDDFWEMLARLNYPVSYKLTRDALVYSFIDTKFNDNIYLDEILKKKGSSTITSFNFAKKLSTLVYKYQVSNENMVDFVESARNFRSDKHENLFQCYMDSWKNKRGASLKQP